MPTDEIKDPKTLWDSDNLEIGRDVEINLKRKTIHIRPGFSIDETHGLTCASLYNLIREEWVTDSVDIHGDKLFGSKFPFHEWPGYGEFGDRIYILEPGWSIDPYSVHLLRSGQIVLSVHDSKKRWAADKK